MRKHRVRYAPLLIWLGNPLMRILDTGVRVLPQRHWGGRERRIYRSLHGLSIRIDADGVLVLPRFAGRTLASMLADPEFDDTTRKEAIERAVVALAEFHRLGFTHGDAMAENVLVDLAPRRCAGPEHSSNGDAGLARWFDFETIHDPRRPMAWRRADDVRALLVTVLVRTVPDKRAETLDLILNVYDDPDVTRLLAASFTSVWRRPLMFHLAQAGLSFQSVQEIARWLRARTGVSVKRETGYTPSAARGDSPR